MNGTEKVVKHLEMIQAIINRLGNNSFWVKGGSLAIIITTAILIPQVSNTLRPDALVVLIPIILGFWTLDGYFLWQERLFRQIYEEVRQQTDTDSVWMSVSTKPSQSVVGHLLFFPSH